MALTASVRDLIVRVVLAEAGGEGPQGQLAVLNVIKNRALSGKWGDPEKGGLTRLLTAPKQFAAPAAVGPNDPNYQRVAAIVDQMANAADVPDPTNGATHFFSPSRMPGGVAPDWASQGTNVRRIGNQIFMTAPLNPGTTAGTVNQPVITGAAMGGPPPVQTSPGGGERPQYQHGVGRIGGLQFHWGSGAPGQYWSIPYGDYPVTPDAPTGPWAHQAGAIPIANNVIPDPLLGRNRIGIMIHSGSGDNLDQLYTQGCFKVAPQDWPNVRAEILAEAQKGPLYLHVQPGGVASFTNTKTLEQTALPTASAPVPPSTTLNPAPATADAPAQPFTPYKVAGAMQPPPASSTQLSPASPPAASPVAPGANDRFQLNYGMPVGQGGQRQMFTSLNLNPGAGAPPAPAPAAPAPQSARPDLTQRVALDQTPTPPPRPPDLAPDLTAPNNAAGGKNPNMMDPRFGNPIASTGMPPDVFASAQRLLAGLFGTG